MSDTHTPSESTSVAPNHKELCVNEALVAISLLNAAEGKAFFDHINNIDPLYLRGVIQHLSFALVEASELYELETKQEPGSWWESWCHKWQQHFAAQGNK